MWELSNLVIIDLPSALPPHSIDVGGTTKTIKNGVKGENNGETIKSRQTILRPSH